MNLIRRVFAFLLVLAMIIPTSAQAESSAQAVVRSFYTHLLSAMKQGEQLGYSGRYKKLDPVIRSTFNLPLMAKTAVGASWTEASPQEQADLTSAFSDFSVATYASRFATYDGEEFTVIGEKKSANGVIVETSIKPKDGEATMLTYLLRHDNAGNYRVVDVFINGTISEMATRRAEFSSIARRDGIPALVNSLGEKSKQLGPS